MLLLACRGAAQVSVAGTLPRSAGRVARVAHERCGRLLTLRTKTRRQSVTVSVRSVPTLVCQTGPRAAALQNGKR